MNLFAHFAGVVETALGRLADDGVIAKDADLSRVTVEAPRDPAHGDITTNAAMVLAKPAGKPPREVAEKLSLVLADDPDIETTVVAGPGFINIRLAAAFWPKLAAAAFSLGEDYGRSQMGAGEKVNVEYVSANPTGPLHVGHCRGAVFGDALANLLQATGYDVTREYYINDAGAQVDVLARSAYLRYREALGEDIGEIPEGLYPGDYLKPVGEALAAEHGDKLLTEEEADWLDLVRDKSIAMMMDLIRDDLAALNIRQEVFASERALHGVDGEGVRTVLDALQAKGLVYMGRLEPPKNLSESEKADWEDREQLLFRSSEHGDDTDRPLVKSDGSFTYFASDVAYALDKYERGFAQMIYILGADHSGYVKRLESVMHAVSDGKSRSVVKLCQLVNLLRGGEPIKMSKRAGNFVTLRDVVDEVGSDVVRFIMLYRKNEAPLEFDFEKVTEQSRDNPVFYVQYAHARICSVLRTAVEECGEEAVSHEKMAEAGFSLLDDPAEIALLRRVAEYPKLLESAAGHHEPHRLAFYLYDLASDFHSLWNLGKESPQLRFIVKDRMHVTLTRLAFLRVIRYVLGNGLRILGVNPVEEM
ncbi:MAG: arginine--tRNA ligase [Rhizobiales bacterium]|nr:arginine--tRNA ligase [Hyphomicrobiales bacterium]